MDNILQAFSDIAECLPIVDRLKATFSNDAHFDQMVGLIYEDLVEFFQRAYKFFRCKGWHFWFTFNWGLFERRFKSILHRLSSHCDHLGREAAAMHFSEMKDFRLKRQLEDEAFEQRTQYQMAENVFRWLAAAEDQQDEQLHWIVDRRQAETCDWVLENPQMESWIGEEGGDPVLWMTGIPGSGKSYLCSLIIQNLQKRTDRSCLYYFCGKTAVGGDTAAVLLRTLAVQLLQQNPEIVPLVYQAFFKNMTNRSGPTMRKILSQLLPAVKVTRLVIDGLDEGKHDVQKEILKSLLDIQKQAGCNCKLLISSREEPQIQHSLSPRSHLKLEGKTSEGSKTYIMAQVKKIQERFPEMNSSLVDRVAERLLNKAQGMFLWVRLVTAMLSDQYSEAEVEHAICDLPDGLDEAYGRILARIDSLSETVKFRIFKILFWMCTAFRPVTIYEVEDGIILRPQQRDLSRKTRTGNLQRDVIDLCAPLLERSSTGVLSLVHFSAKEFFIHAKSGPFIDVTKAHLSVALSCIINITTSLDVISQKSNTTNDLEIKTRTIKGNFGLHYYGHEFWAEHTVSYLARAGDLNGEGRELISALEDMSSVLKDRSGGNSPATARLPKEDSFAAGLERLNAHPLPYNLVSSWLRFKSQLRDAKLTFDSRDAQQEWRLRTDETRLSLIDFHLCKITEELLMMKFSEMPACVDLADYNYFISRFKLRCRYFDCNDHFTNSRDRDAHEATHTPTYPCLQCDFVERGFKTRKELEKHIQLYHMRPEDFKIPADIKAASGPTEADNLLRGFSPSLVSNSWNERGRKALKHGFHQLLSKVESRLEFREQESFTKYTANVDSIRRKVDAQHYGSLLDFKVDLRALVDNSEEPSTHDGFERIGSLLNGEMEKAMSGYPSFAQLTHEAFEDDSCLALSNHRAPGMGNEGHFSEHWGDLSSFRALPHEEKQPRWSSKEEEIFLDLLHRYGRDFVKIADILKTKSAAEVDRHLNARLESGKTDWLELANHANARSSEELPHVDSIEDTRARGDVDSALSRPDEPVLSLHAESYLPQLHDSQRFSDPPRSRDHGGHRNEADAETTGSTKDSRKAKRKPRPRVRCAQCHIELHDEYAWNRHVLRRHTAMRKVWLCEDNSVDQRFLSGCESCQTSKRYSSKTSASKHLREAHFHQETPNNVLHRWMREQEEPNPNFQDHTSETASQNQRAIKRHKPNVTSLPPVRFDPGSLKSDPLPSIVGPSDDNIIEVGQSGITSPKTSESDANNDSDYDLVQGITFDNMLPRLHNVLSTSDGDVNLPHRADKFLIKPDQVLRLPHLDTFQRNACQDQVNALYHRLDSLPTSSPPYQENLRELSLLSRKLRNDLRNWQWHSKSAPEIPFSL